MKDNSFLKKDDLLKELELQNKINDSLLSCSENILNGRDFEETARAVFDYCRMITGATSGSVALLSENGDENEVLFLEAGGLPCSVDPELPMPIRGLREVAYKTKKSAYDNNFMKSNWAKFMPKGHVNLRNVLFVPLTIEGKTLGIIGLANKDTDFTDEDAKNAEGFGRLAAIALLKSRMDEEREVLINDLKTALDEVKTLSGFIPICSYCKNIRDDAGYWSRLEEYIAKRSDANFTHSICPACMEKQFPEVKKKINKN
jgi:transcriptional regulator with GAF, ATPase, and Fis domain